MNWDDLRFFLSVARQGSLAEAGRELKTDATTVGRRLKSLEHALGVRLFLRSSSGWVLTAAGERIRSECERMQEHASRITAGAGDDTPVGTVRIATTEAMALRLVELGLGELRARYPALTLELITSNRPVDLMQREADLALRLMRPTQAELVGRKLGELHFGLYASARARPLPSFSGSLQGMEVVAPSGELQDGPEARWLAAHQGTRIALRSSSLLAQAMAIRQGVGLGVLPRSLADEDPSLVLLASLDDIQPRPMYLVAHRDALARVAVRVAAETLAAVVARVLTAPLKKR